VITIVGVSNDHVSAKGREGLAPRTVAGDGRT
jgi:hypothetical protein